MKLPLKSPASKILSLVLAFSLVGVFLLMASSQFLAAISSEKNTLVRLQRAIRLQPLNAEYRYRLGSYFSLLQPDAAAQSYRAAVSLNPHVSRYWLGLATAYASLGNATAQASALQDALKTSPTDADVIWQAANIYDSSGNITETLNQCQRLLEANAPAVENALPFCWNVKPDVDLFTQKLLPRNADTYQSFLYLLMSRRETFAATKAWDALVKINSPIQREPVFDYVHYLLTERQPDFAIQAWQQAAPLADLSDYQPSDKNLIVNGNFSLPILNGGLDWTYTKSDNISLALDAKEHHSGNRSLRISFDNAQIEDAGVQQLIFVHPNQAYNFFANFKTQDMEGAGGMQFVLQDAYNGNIVFSSDNLTDAADWEQTNGALKTGPDSKLLVLRLRRVPAGDVIKGKLWIDGVRLTGQQP